MKILASLLFLSATIAQAKDIAHYKFAVQDYSNHEVIMVEATLEDNRDLEVTAKSFTGEGHGPIFFPNELREDITLSKKLNELTFERILNKVKSLSRAEIVTTHHDVVCALMPGPEASNDHLSVKRNFDWNLRDFTGDMELVSGPTGCWLVTQVQPADEWNLREANELKQVLKVLSLEMFNL